MHAYRVEDFIELLAEFGVEAMEMDLPLHDGRIVPTLTLIRQTEDGRLTVPLGTLQRDQVVAPNVVDSWCDQLQVPRVGYGAIED